MSAAGASLNAGTTPVRPGFDLNKVALARWMEDHIADFKGPITVAQFKGGQSNPTYKVTTPHRAYVLRRKPPGPLLQGAHAIEREAEVMSKLADAGFPAPRVYGLCTDESVIGSRFYVMEMVEGRIFWDCTIPGVPREERAALFDAMNDTIARLHRFDYAAVGLAEFGRTGNYFKRQLARWSRQYRDDRDAGREPELDRIIAWLEDNMPSGGETRLVHGDFRIDNMIFHPTEPRVLAVLDWELSTLGHPGADFTYHAMMYHMPSDIVAGLRGVAVDALGVPSEADYLQAYCRRTGRSAMPDYDYGLAFNFFRLAAIFHGIKGRVIRGTAVSPYAKERASKLQILVELCRQKVERASRRL